jgi:GntR family transcriptional regulator/MocR family aminotransferase
MRGVYAERLDVLARLVGKYLSDFVEPRVPIGGLQLPCVLTGDLQERIEVDAARRAGIELLGLSALHHARAGEAGFLMGFAAYTPFEIEGAVKKLAKALRAATKS